MKMNKLLIVLITVLLIVSCEDRPLVNRVSENENQIQYLFARIADLQFSIDMMRQQPQTFVSDSVYDDKCIDGYINEFVSNDGDLSLYRVTDTKCNIVKKDRK